jgi:hypothetical protein
MISKLFKPSNRQRQASRQAELYRNLIRHEARIGGKLFGKIPDGTRREFFCLDGRTWVWHEEWNDASQKRQSRTTRYDVRPNGIFKDQEGQPYQLVSLDEARNLYQAALLYEQMVNDELYNFV